MKQFAADLHVHTALSPCAMEEMTPPNIVEAALREGLQVIAICDHNSSENAAAVQDAAGADLCVVAGIEVTTSEEAHVVGLFPDADKAHALSMEIAETLPHATEASAAHFGEQPVIGARGRRVGRVAAMLAAASGFNLSETVERIKSHGGLAIAAHLDRPSFSVVSQLGLFPSEVPFDAVEVSAVGREAGRHHSLALMGLPVIASSDSHFLSELGSCSTMFEMADATFDELALSLQGTSGRRCFLA